MLILLFAILRNSWRLDSKCYISFLVNTTLFCIYIAYDIWHGFSFYCKNWWWWYCTSTILCRNFIHFRFIFDYFEYCTECTLCLLHRIPRKFSFFFFKKKLLLDYFGSIWFILSNNTAIICLPKHWCFYRLKQKLNNFGWSCKTIDSKNIFVSLKMRKLFFACFPFPYCNFTHKRMELLLNKRVTDVHICCVFFYYYAHKQILTPVISSNAMYVT